ncbi:response regulator transcription factor [Cohnella fermenti]|uniref:Response regulator transcription factor n=1 Tax=Cohnella fermenti TaxID=2565925 RepID=A0A4S4BRA1_9BACL|nr:response regulator transcription factor [Cohnella fermenti]THF77519.1 response regulator transcription factor [Cohnella fermenti]
MTAVLLIEDDPDIRELVLIYLRREGYRVDAAADAKQGLRLFDRRAYDLVLSDIMLPGMDGLELARSIRERSDVPIIFLTSKKEPQDIVAGLRIGGDDYVTKPFEPEVLVARVQAGLRRYRSAGRAGDALGVWTDGRLAVDAKRLEVRRDGELVALPAKELQLLLLLLKHPNQVFGVTQLYERIWGIDGTSDERTVMVHIHHLRKKIERDPANPKYVETVRGFGYKFGGGERPAAADGESSTTSRIGKG